MTGVIDRIRQAICGAHGHDALLQFERERVYLKCYSCGFESPGWTISRAATTVASRESEAPRAIVRPRLVGARRVA